MLLSDLLAAEPGSRQCLGRCQAWLPPSAFGKDIVIEGPTGLRTYPRKQCRQCQNADQRARRPSRARGPQTCQCCTKSAQRLEQFDTFRVCRKCHTLLRGLAGEEVRGGLTLNQLVAELEYLVEHRMARTEAVTNWRSDRRITRVQLRELGGELAVCRTSNHNACLAYEALYRRVLSFHQNHIAP